MPVKRQRFAARRKAVGFSQEQLAERLSIDRSTVARWESGETEPSVDTTSTRRILQVSVDQLDGLLADGGLTDSEAAERMNYTLKHPAAPIWPQSPISGIRCRNSMSSTSTRLNRVACPTPASTSGKCASLPPTRERPGPARTVRRGGGSRHSHGPAVWDASQRRDHTSAQMYLNQAIQAARQVRDGDGRACAATQGHDRSLRGTQPQEGLTLAKQTAETTGHVSDVLPDSPRCTLPRRTHAGGPGACEAALAVADVQLGRVDETDVAVQLYSVTQLGRMAGSCYLFLEDTDVRRDCSRKTAASSAIIQSPRQSSWVTWPRAYQAGQPR